MAGKYLFKGKYNICALLPSPNATRHMWEKNNIIPIVTVKRKIKLKML
jgi:hypothetical protein